MFNTYQKKFERINANAELLAKAASQARALLDSPSGKIDKDAINKAIEGAMIALGTIQVNFYNELEDIEAELSKAGLLPRFKKHLDELKSLENLPEFTGENRFTELVRVLDTIIPSYFHIEQALVEEKSLALFREYLPPEYAYERGQSLDKAPTR
jgi:hypothetical protein